MEFVTKRDDIVDNLKTFEKYLRSTNKKEKAFALGMMKESTTIIVYKANGENHFAPSVFMGFKNNTMEDHLKNEKKEAKDVNLVLTKIIGNHFINDPIEQKYIAYTSAFHKVGLDNTRKYWRIKDERGKNLDFKM